MRAALAAALTGGALLVVGCGGDSAASETTDAAPAPVVPAFSPTVAADVFGGFIDAHRQQRWEDAETFWPEAFRVACGGRLGVIEAFRVADDQVPGWPRFELGRVLSTSTNPYPSATFRTTRPDGEVSPMTVSFVEENGRWMLADPLPTLAFSLCTAPEDPAPTPGTSSGP